MNILLLFFLIKGINKTIENETKKQRDEFLWMLLSAFGACWLWDMLAGKSEGVIRAGKRKIRAGQDF